MNDEIFIATTGSGLARASRRAPGHWEVERLLPGRDIQCLAADPLRPEVWHLSAAPGPAQAHSHDNAQAAIFRCDGGHWRRLEGGLPQPLNHMPYTLCTRCDAPGLLYAGLSNGAIWQSADYGEQRARLPVTLGSIQRSMIML